MEGGTDSAAVSQQATSTILTPDQRVRFKTLHDRWQQDTQKRPPAPGKHED